MLNFTKIYRRLRINNNDFFLCETTSYFGEISTKIDLKLIPEFSGNNQQSVTEWLEKGELVCKKIGVTDLASVVRLRLTNGAFAVYQQLAETDKEIFNRIKETLLKVFAVNAFTAYE